MITTSSITFRWEVSPTANLYQLQVSTTSDFYEKVLDTTSDTNSYSIILSDGFYYWRVRAKNDFDWSPWSYARRLQVLTKEVRYTVYFYTNPSNAYITFSGADYSNGASASCSYGSYSIKANAPIGYTFYSWSTSGDVSISNLYSPYADANIRGICTITANFKPKDGSAVPILFITYAPEVMIRRGEEIAFTIKLANTGKFCGAELWFKSLPEGVGIVDKGGLKTIDVGGSADFNVRIKANQTAREGNYICQVAGDAKDAQRNWQSFILRVVSSGPASETTTPTIIPTFSQTPTPIPTPLITPIITTTSAPTPTQTPMPRISGFEAFLAIIALGISLIYIIRRKSGEF